MFFYHTTLGQRVLFGTGRAAENLATEVTRLRSRKVMVIASDSKRSTARKVVSRIDVAVWHSDVVMHVPAEKAETARRAATQGGVDLIVSVGGGSTTGLAKAVALTTGIPIIAVPTTYAGSEATNVWGLTEAARKTTGVDDRVLPISVVYDAELTLSLPVELSVASGLNGIAHCIDSLWGPRANPINAALAAEGLRALVTGLPAIATDPTDMSGREQSLYGAYLAAVAFASAGSGLHHKICHVLGGTFNLRHAETHAIVLPYVLAYNAPAAPAEESSIASAFGSSSALESLQALLEQLRAPKALADYGFTAEGIQQAVEIILPLVPPNNPRPITRANLTTLLNAAFTGQDPTVLSARPKEGSLR